MQSFSSTSWIVLSPTTSTSELRKVYMHNEGSDHYATSLFFPATGERYSTSGKLQHLGHNGWYGTSSANTTANGIVFRLRARSDTPYYPDVWGVELYIASKTFSAAIRRVVDES